MIRFLKILLFMSLILADITAFSLILRHNPGIVEYLYANNLLLLSASSLILIFPALPLYMLITRQNLLSILPLKPIGWKNAFYILLMTYLLSPAAWLLSALTSLFYPNAALGITEMFTLENLPAAIATIAVLPSIIEEIIFRGVVLSDSKGFGITLAVVINGILFGLIHMNPQQIPYALFLGLIFTLFVIHTNSIYSSILAHFLVNATNLLMALMQPDNMEQATLSTEGLLPSLSILTVIALIFFWGFLSVYKRFWLHNFVRNST